jgi:hypothetical protein
MLDREFGRVMKMICSLRDKDHGASLQGGDHGDREADPRVSARLVSGPACIDRSSQTARARSAIKRLRTLGQRLQGLWLVNLKGRAWKDHVTGKQPPSVWRKALYLNALMEVAGGAAHHERHGPIYSSNGRDEQEGLDPRGRLGHE